MKQQSAGRHTGKELAAAGSESFPEGGSGQCISCSATFFLCEMGLITVPASRAEVR